jgi:hypothetical protein
MMNDGVQTTSRAFDANRPLLGDNERHDDGFFQGNHNGFDYT